MKRTLIIIFLLGVFGPQCLYAVNPTNGTPQQDLKLTIYRSFKNYTTKMVGVAKLSIDELNIVKGEIDWHVTIADRKQYLFNVNDPGTEYVKGNYDPATKTITMTPHSKSDPNRILPRFEDYNITFTTANAFEGTTTIGSVNGTYIITSNKPAVPQYEETQTVVYNPANAKNESALRGTKVTNMATEMPDPKKTTYYALLIGVQEYTDPAIRKLDEPVKDAENLAKVLIQNYNFQASNVTRLANPTRSQIFDELDKLSRLAGSNDHVLIFYAGHGNWDADRSQGYWYPADAQLSKRGSWITNADLTEYITGIKARHTLLITDACFSGGIFKSRAISSTMSLGMQELYRLRSRKAMTSGTLKEVPDRSNFMKYLLQNLVENTSAYLPAEELFSRLRTAVIYSSKIPQTPQFGTILGAGDEGGEFIFVKK